MNPVIAHPHAEQSIRTRLAEQGLDPDLGL